MLTIRPCPAGAQIWNSRAAGVEDAIDIDPERFAPFVDALRLSKQSEPQNSGAIDEYVQTAKFARHALDGIADGVAVSDVRLRNAHLAAERGNLLGHVAQAFSADVDQADTATGRSQRQRDGSPDAGAAARDNRHFRRPRRSPLQLLADRTCFRAFELVWNPFYQMFGDRDENA